MIATLAQIKRSRTARILLYSKLMCTAYVMEGYAKLSSLMALDSEFAIYRKFGALNAQNLLYYQAELVTLETDLREIAMEDRRSSQDSEKRLFSENWYTLSNAEPGKDSQLKKVMQIRRTLKEYSPQVPSTNFC